VPAQLLLVDDNNLARPAGDALQPAHWLPGEWVRYVARRQQPGLHPHMVVTWLGLSRH